MAESSRYIDQVLGELHHQAQANDLIVDSSATYAAKTIFREALAQAEMREGGLSVEPGAEFDRTALCLAEEATAAARRDGVHVIGGQHVEIAALKLRSWDFWPFTGD